MCWALKSKSEQNTYSPWLHRNHNLSGDCVIIITEIYTISTLDRVSEEQWWVILVQVTPWPGVGSTEPILNSNLRIKRVRTGRIGVEDHLGRENSKCKGQRLEISLGIESNMTGRSGNARLGSGLVDLVESLIHWPGNNETSLKNFCQGLMRL